MSPLRVALLTLAAVLAFAGNSLLCRAALSDTTIDAASFTTLRLLSGALVLWLVVRLRATGHEHGGSWMSALALFAYAAGFSFAYVNLSAATGALLLFGAVQATMLGRGLWLGERLSARQLFGLAMAMGGLVVLLLPGLTAPPIGAALMMIAAGVAWGVYTLRGRDAQDAIAATAGNFLRAVTFTVAVSLLMLQDLSVDAEGVAYAVLSGALTSGLGYAVWYTVLPALRATQAATVQLSVPVIAAVGGVLLLGEQLSPRLIMASAAVLGGIALTIVARAKAEAAPAKPSPQD